MTIVQHQSAGYEDDDSRYVQADTDRCGPGGGMIVHIRLLDPGKQLADLYRPYDVRKLPLSGSVLHDDVWGDSAIVPPRATGSDRDGHRLMLV